MRILDLFCKAGGAAEGYRRAGFEVVGVDIAPQPRYPGYAIERDALKVLRNFDDYDYAFGPFDAIHASPPCQRWSAMSRCRPGLAEEYPDLIGPVRELLQATGLPYVIENVPGSPLVDPVTLCGTSFGLGASWNGQRFELRRPRRFETNFPLPSLPCSHRYRVVPVYGHGAPGNRPDLRGAPVAQMAREAMGIDWMNRDELDEAIPPAFTRYVGLALVAHLMNRGEEAA